jgi:gas vesicle protein
MKGFLVGFGVGFIAGLLFAPMTGEDARVIAGVKASEVADDARETYQRMKETVGKAVEGVRSPDSATGTGTLG